MTKSSIIFHSSGVQIYFLIGSQVKIVVLAAMLANGKEIPDDGTLNFAMPVEELCSISQSGFCP